MTLESTISRETFVGNGTTKSFDFTFKVWDETQILVYRQVTNYSEDDCTSECTISINDTAGGTVTFGTAPASGVVIAVVRNMPFLQEDVYSNGVVFDAKEIEGRFDQDCAERQQLLLGVTQAVKVPNTDSRTSEEYAADFWEAVEDTETNKNISEDCANTACSCADRACEEADRSRDEADRAEEERIKAGQLAVLGGTAENLEATWSLSKDYSAGATIDLPVPYYPGRTVLHVSYDGMELYKGSQYEEIGDDKETPSYSIQTLMDLDSGAEMHVWVVMSTVAKYASDLMEELRQAEETMTETKDSCIDEMKEALSEYLDEAETCRDEACQCATNAKTSQEIAENAAVEATEQADRADDAAADAQTAAADAKKAAVCAYRYRKGRCLGAVSDEGYLDSVPNGFWVINPNVTVPATVQHSLIPLPPGADLPTTCDGFFVFAPAFVADPCPDTGDTGGSGGGGGTGGTSTPARNTIMQPCGARQRYSTV